MEREQAFLKDIYKILGLDFKLDIINVPLRGYDIENIDIKFDINVSSYKMEKNPINIDRVDLTSFTPKEIKGKVSKVDISVPLRIFSEVELVNRIPMRRFPISWRTLSDDEKLFLLQEIKSKWPDLSTGLKIIGIYREVPIERIDTMTVDESTGVLSFTLKDASFGEIEKNNLLVFKFVEDERIRSLVF
ncbi:MAG: hypothetical protein ACP5RW_01925 [bacterium]